MTHASVHPMLGGRTDALSVYLLWMQAEIKSTNSIAPVEPMVKKISTGALDVLCSREYVLVDLNSSSAPVEPTLQNQPPVHWMYYVPESLFELISKPLQHRLNRCPYGACTGAMTQAWILCQNPQRLLFGHRETGWTDAFNFSPIGSSDGHDFSAVDFQRLCDPLHSI